ncbi:iron-containing redox enzyme family protein [Streptomyces sp. NPDC056601]|uniref:iron-containing redox enzyme family protein n=1 Tax=Streptomyces sp. NPDC056601 TaxID=3345875 RepID=UPI00369B9B07
MTLQPLGERIKGKLALLQPTLSVASRQVLEYPDQASFYPWYIATMHGISRAAVPLMQAAVRAVEARPDDEVSNPLRDYLMKHIPEELGHDEWALEDLEVIGVDRETVLGHIPSPSLAALVGAQYYWIEHVHPVAIMGYLAVMESNAPSPDAVRHLMNATRFPQAAFRSMEIHSRLDVRHSADVYEMLDGLETTDRHARLVAISAMSTTEALIQVITDLVSHAANQPELRAGC